MEKDEPTEIWTNKSQNGNRKKTKDERKEEKKAGERERAYAIEMVPRQLGKSTHTKKNTKHRGKERQNTA